MTLHLDWMTSQLGWMTSQIAGWLHNYKKWTSLLRFLTGIIIAWMHKWYQNDRLMILIWNISTRLAHILIIHVLYRNCIKLHFIIYILGLKYKSTSCLIIDYVRDGTADYTLVINYFYLTQIMISTYYNIFDWLINTDWSDSIIYKR